MSRPAWEQRVDRASRDWRTEFHQLLAETGREGGNGKEEAGRLKAALVSGFYVGQLPECYLYIGDIKSQLPLKEDKKIMCSGNVSDHSLEASSPGAESRWGCVSFYRHRK